MTSLAQRQHIMKLIDEAVAAGARQAKACELIELGARTLQRWQADQQQGDRRPDRVQEPPNRLSKLDRQRILSIVNSEEYGHLSPAQIVPRLADEGMYLASESTVYRLLRDAGQLQHRGRQQERRSVPKPRAVTARAPNEVYSWDITYLPAAIKGQFYYLYLFLDLFSRKIVGWQVYDAEDGERASELMRDICLREGIAPGQVVLHSDNGSPMKGLSMLATLQELAVVPSYSRPAVSNDNPYSESLFRTLKYRPQYPPHPFKSLAQARQWVAQFVSWYNTEHRHSAIRFVTPEQRHNGEDKALLAKRRALYQAERAKHPQRWSGPVRNWSHIDVVHLNPEKKHATSVAQHTILKRAA